MKAQPVLLGSDVPGIGGPMDLWMRLLLYDLYREHVLWSKKCCGGGGRNIIFLLPALPKEDL